MLPGGNGATQSESSALTSARIPTPASWNCIECLYAVGVSGSQRCLIMARGHHRETKGPSQRQLRVGELVRHTLSELFTRGDVHDQVIQRHLTHWPARR